MRPWIRQHWLLKELCLKISRECCKVDNRIVMILWNHTGQKNFKSLLWSSPSMKNVWTDHNRYIGISTCFHSFQYNLQTVEEWNALRKGALSVSIFSLLVNLCYLYFFPSVHENMGASFFSVGITGLLKFWIKNSINVFFLQSGLICSQ